MDSAESVSDSKLGHSEIFVVITCNSGCRLTVPRFSRLPVERSSMTTTDLPSCKRRSTRCEPMKPAPPVTMTGRLFSGVEFIGRETGCQLKRRRHWSGFESARDANRRYPHVQSALGRRLQPVVVDIPDRQSGAPQQDW